MLSSPAKALDPEWGRHLQALRSPIMKFLPVVASALLFASTGLVAYNLAADDFQPTAQTEYVPDGTKLELLWGEGEFTEGPALAPDGSILFSDIGNRILRFD